MRGLGRALALVAGLGLAAAAGAQLPGPGPRIPDLAPGDGTVRGRVVHASRAEAAADVDVVLYGLSPGGEGGVRAARSDADGRFAFEGISSDPQIAYLVIGRFGGVSYPGTSLRFSADGPRVHEVEVRVADVTLEPSRVKRVASRVLIDPDAAVLAVREAHTLAVEGEEWVAAPEGASLLRLPIPAGAEDLRFDAATTLGLVPDPAGGLALLGPLPPGESTVNLQYRLPADGSFRRQLGGRVPLLSIYVADAGDLRLESDRLHRRRPVRTGDRTYAHLEAFEVGADEEIVLGLAQLPPRRTFSRPVRLGAFALLTLGVIGAVVAPLRRRPGDAGAAELAGDEAWSAARRERNAVYASLRDLEHDHETQKIGAADYAQLRDELRARAVALLREEKEAQASRPPTPDAASTAPPRCSACAAELRAEDRFCSHCGASQSEREARA